MKSLNKKLNDKQNLVLIGRIVGAHGLKGILNVYPFTETLAIYNSINKLIVEVRDSYKLLLVNLVWSKAYRNVVRICINNIKNRNEAEILIGSKIYINRSELPKLEKDTYFYCDLIGIDVRSIFGEEIGRLSSIISTGSNDVYVVKRKKDHIDSEVLIPAIKSVIIDIDLVNNMMFVDLTNGLLN